MTKRYKTSRGVEQLNARYVKACHHTAAGKRFFCFATNKGKHGCCQLQNTVISHPTKEAYFGAPMVTHPV